ncbi:hypothetical protein D3C85_1349220 [compost metagenome]
MGKGISCAVQRLIQNQQSRAIDERIGQRQLILLIGRHTRCSGVAQRPELGKEVVNLSTCACIWCAFGTHRNMQILLDRQLREYPPVL